MELPGLTLLGGQPTLTNPLNQQALVVGRENPAQAGSQTSETQTQREQASTSFSQTEVVSQAESPEAQSLNPESAQVGRFIDVKA